MNDDKIIFVAGATGQQGGAVAAHLLKDGWKLRTLSRDPNKAAAQALATQGVEVLAGSFEDAKALHSALQGVYGVFSVQTPMEHGPVAETAQGKALADAAQSAKVAHFIYSSVGGADRNSGIPHFESKWQVEQYLVQLNMATTVFRPVFFMDNFLKFMGPQKQGDKLILTMALKPDTSLQMIAADDIGAFVAFAFKHPNEYEGKSLEIGGDEQTSSQIAQTFGQALGQPVEFIEQPMAQLRAMSEENALMFEWFNNSGYQANIKALRNLYPELSSLETFLTKHKSELL